MSIATLLNPDDPFFPFDHDQLHRQMYARTGSSANTAIPYFLDPITDAAVPAGWFNTLHAQAHQDFASSFPAIYWPSTVALKDIVEGPDEWWSLSNRQLHNLALSVL